MIERTVKATAHHDSVHELPKLTSLVDGKRRIVERPPTLIKLRDMTRRWPIRHCGRIARRCRRTGAFFSIGIG